MRLNDNAVAAFLLRITSTSFAIIHQQRQPSGTVFSGCGFCHFADCAGTPSSSCEWKSNHGSIPFPAFKSARNELCFKNLVSSFRFHAVPMCVGVHSICNGGRRCEVSVFARGSLPSAKDFGRLYLVFSR